MGHSDIPWERDHWLGDVDPRPLAMLRVGMGVVLLQDIATRWPHRRALLSDEGMLPRGVQGEPWAWSLFDLFGAPSTVSLALLIGAAIAVLLTIGFHTRVVTPLAWLFTQSLQNRNLFVGDGGDDFLRVLLFWAIFTDLGAVWSLDARRLGPRRAPALGARLLALQVALVYAAAGLNKLRGSWLDPDIVYQSLQHLGYLRPPGEALLAHPGLCRAVARFTLVAELTIPALIVSPFFVARCRGAAIILNIALQAGLFLTLRVGIWTGLLLITSVLFLQPAWLDRVAALTLPTKLGKPGWPSRWPSRWDGRHA
ncbi:MAG: HTTM domain-containing protein, partial [Myxococcales bacterium]|nr:HTTM domain-containing protein [Myxococcales bacterium]